MDSPFLNKDVKPMFASVVEELKFRLSCRQDQRRALKAAKNSIDGDRSNPISSDKHQQWHQRDTRPVDLSTTATLPRTLSAPLSDARPCQIFMSSPLSINEKPATTKVRDWISTLSLPLSPPQSPKAPKRSASTSTPLCASSLAEVVRQRRAGHITGLEDKAWLSHRLSAAEYDRFQALLQEEEGLAAWYEDNFRYDWDAEAGVYTIRMPTPLHEFFIRSFIAEICSQINVFAEAHQELKGVVDKIRDGGSPSIVLRPAPSSSQEDATSTCSDDEKDGQLARQVTGPTITRCPDGTLFFPDHGYPSAVLEVSYTQKRKDLPYLADSYIVDSQHEIKTVLGLDIEYHRSTPPTKRAAANQEPAAKNKTATISYWTPDIVIDSEGDPIGASQARLEHEPFRSAAGLPLPGNLDICLAAFVPTDVVAALPAPIKDTVNRLSLDISYAKLCTMLEEAEKMHATIKSRGQKRKRKSGEPMGKPTKWRKRKRTPSEELSEGREERFRQMEAREEEHATLGDEAFEPGRRTRRRVGRE